MFRTKRKSIEKKIEAIEGEIQEMNNLNAEFYKKEEAKKQRKEKKKEFGRWVRFLIIYTFMQLGMYLFFISAAGGIAIVHKDLNLDKMFDYIDNSGWHYLLACLVSYGIWKRYCRKTNFEKPLFYTKSKMTAKVFAISVMVASACQLLAMPIMNLIEKAFNQVGYSMEPAVETATATSTGISMFLYASIVGPIMEELIFRGALLRVFEKFGKKFAIIATAFLFGVFHGNIVQFIFGFLIGLVYAYIALEYSLKWTIALHMFNNLVLSDLIGLLSRMVDVKIINTVYTVFILGSTIFTIIYILMKRKQIRNVLAESKDENGIYKTFFTAGWIIFYIIFNIFMVILSAQPLA